MVVVVQTKEGIAYEKKKMQKGNSGIIAFFRNKRKENEREKIKKKNERKKKR